MQFFMPASNLVLLGSGIAASSQSVYFPVSLIAKSRQACDVWRSATGNASETLTIDLAGSWKTADYPLGLSFLVDSWNAQDVCSAVTITLVGPGTVIPLTLPGLTPAGQQPNPQAYNIPLNAITGTTALLITFTKTLTTTFLQVGKLFVGSYLDAGNATGPDGQGIKQVWADSSNINFSIAHQRFSEVKAQFWQVELDIPNLAEAIAALLRVQVFKAVGTFAPFWVIVEPDAAGAGLLDLPHYCYLTAPMEEDRVAASPVTWTMAFKLEQQL